jgi:hypothetical protein
MVDYAKWFFEEQKSGLYTAYDDSTAQKVAEDATNATNTKFTGPEYFWHFLIKSDKEVANNLISNLEITPKSPQILGIVGIDKMSGIPFAMHLVIVYAYNYDTGVFYIYDPNWPGIENTINFDGENLAYVYFPRTLVTDVQFAVYTSNIYNPIAMSNVFNKYCFSWLLQTQPSEEPVTVELTVCCAFVNNQPICVDREHVVPLSQQPKLLKVYKNGTSIIGYDDNGMKIMEGTVALEAVDFKLIDFECPFCSPNNVEVTFAGIQNGNTISGSYKGHNKSIRDCCRDFETDECLTNEGYVVVGEYDFHGTFSIQVLKQCYNVAVAVLHGGTIPLLPPPFSDIEIAEALDALRNQAMQQDPERVVAKSFLAAGSATKQLWNVEQ